MKNYVSLNKKVLLGYDLRQFWHVVVEYLCAMIDKLYHWVPPVSQLAISISTRHCRQGSTSTLMSVTGDHMLLANKAVIYGNLLTCDVYIVHSLAARDPSLIPVLSTVTSFCLKDFSWPDAQTRCSSVNIEVISLDIQTHVYVGHVLHVHVYVGHCGSQLVSSWDERSQFCLRYLCSNGSRISHKRVGATLKLGSPTYHLPIFFPESCVKNWGGGQLDPSLL